jgi:hypothetical protein
MQELDAAIQAGTSDVVKVWLNWMFLMFALSLIFVWKNKPARFVLLAFVLTMPVGLAIWKMSGNIDLLGIAHLLIWTPLLAYLYLKVIKTDGFNAKSFYGVWIILVCATIVISLLFDVRDIFLVMTGVK